MVRFRCSANRTGSQNRNDCSGCSDLRLAAQQTDIRRFALRALDGSCNLELKMHWKSCPGRDNSLPARQRQAVLGSADGPNGRITKDGVEYWIFCRHGSGQWNWQISPQQYNRERAIRLSTSSTFRIHLRITAAGSVQRCGSIEFPLCNGSVAFEIFWRRGPYGLPQTGQPCVWA